MKKETLMEYLESLHPISSAKSYHYSIVKFLSANPGAEKYGYQDILDYLLKLKKKGLSGTYRSKILTSIKIYYAYLMVIGVREKHPCRGMQIKTNYQKGMDFEALFTTEELEQLLEREERYKYLGHRNKFLISILIYQGLASNEIENLSVQDIDIDAATIRVRTSRSLTGRTLEMHRTQPILALKYLDESRPYLVRDNMPTNKLFITKLGRAENVDGIHAMLQPLKGFFPHKILNAETIRMSVIANWLNERKIPLEDVQMIAGHKWPSSTERYQRADMNEQRRLINEFHPLND